MIELWREINGYNGLYLVSDLGRVKSASKKWRSGNGKIDTKPETILKQSVVGGYLQVTLSLNGKSSMFKVHRLVAIAFIDNPENKPEVNHIFGNKLDNRSIVLEWVTSTENKLHAYRSRLRVSPVGQSHHKSKLVLNIDNGVYYECLREAIESTPFKRSKIEAMMSGRNKNTTYLRYV